MLQSSSSRTWGTLLIILVIGAIAALNLITKKSLEGMVNFVSQIQQKVSGKPATKSAESVQLRLKVTKNKDEKPSSSKSSDDQQQNDIVKATVQVIRRRLDLLGFHRASLEIQDDSSILVKIPGVINEQYIELITESADLSFHLVDSQLPEPLKADFPELANGAEAFEQIVSRTNPETRYNVLKTKLISANHFDSVKTGVDSASRQAYLQFTLNSEAAAKFATLTKQLVGKKIAIVLQSRGQAKGRHVKQVLAAPRIMAPILEGVILVSGGFSIQDVTEIAILLSTGPLPATVTVVEKRTIAPKTGADPPKAS